MLTKNELHTNKQTGLPLPLTTRAVNRLKWLFKCRLQWQQTDVSVAMVTMSARDDSLRRRRYMTMKDFSSEPVSTASWKTSSWNTETAWDTVLCPSVVCPKNQSQIRSLWQAKSELRSVTRSDVTQFYLQPDISEHTPPSAQPVRLVLYPLTRRDGRLSWPRCPDYAQAGSWTHDR